MPPSLVSLYDMLHNFTPFIEIGMELGQLLEKASLYGRANLKEDVSAGDAKTFRAVVERLQQECIKFGFRPTARQAASVLERFPPHFYTDLLQQITHLNVSLRGEMEEEGLVRIPYDRVSYFEQPELFGPEVAAAFPSSACKRDIERAGSCYALNQPDACVYHSMLVVERGLHALALQFQAPFDYRQWGPILSEVEKNLKTMHPGKTKHFYEKALGEFGFFRGAYRNHASHVHDDPYDINQAKGILDHVRDFMKSLAENGLKE